MAKRPSKYSDTFDYDHRFHAGNVGDVFKHSVLRAWIQALQGDRALRIIDTHAGAGMFKLPAQGEWLEGIGRLDSVDSSTAPDLVRSYLAVAGSKRKVGKGGLYPGSPAFIRGLLRPQDRLDFFELMDDPREKLAAHYSDDAQVKVSGGDGLTGLTVAGGQPFEGQLAGFVDPAYVSKAEWQTVATSVIAAKAARPDLALCIWYPIKSLMRPQALRGALQKAGLAGATVDLISTPLRLKRKRLNGSGLLFIDPPAGFLATLNGALPWLGETLASDGEWTTSVTSWTAG